MNSLREKYDVIVVGAGPAGGSCARELAKMGRKVLIIERSAEIGELNYSTAGTPLETIIDFDLPKSIIFTHSNAVEFRGPSTTKKWQYNKAIGYTLKFRELNQFLAKNAVDHGADISNSNLVEDLLIKDGKVIGVKCSDPKHKEILADVVVDATGVDGKLAIKLGLRNNKKLRFGITYEQWMTGIKTDPHCVVLGFNTKYAPGGYWWIFPTGLNTAKVGIAIMPHIFKKNKITTPNMQELFVKLISQTPSLKEAKEIEIHSHPDVVDVGGIKRYSSNGFIVIGAAAAQVNPLLGEGIRHCLHSGRIAAKVISEAIKKQNFSQKQLSNYDKAWKKYIGNKWRLSLWMENLLLHELNDRYLDSLIAIIQNLSSSEFLKFIWSFDLRGIKKGLIEKVKNKFDL